MSLIPDTKVGKIEFNEAHVEAFTTNAVAIGTTSAAVTAWAATVTAARAAYEAQQAARLAAKDATGNLNLAIDAMMNATSSLIKQIRAKAELSGDSVYTLASLPIPQPPSARPAPGKPTDLTVSLDESGELTLKWKCPNPAGTSGTIYQVWRRIGPEGEFVYLGGAGNKKFVDASLPAGSAAVVYKIQAVRSTVVGPVATFNVNFGVGGAGGAGGMMVSSVDEGTPGGAAKIAA